MNTENEVFVQAAVYYRSLGLAPIPLQPRSKAPLESNWERFSAELPSEETVAGWWARRPHANIGLVTGRASNIFVLDVDGLAGKQSLEGRPIPLTPRSRTGSGGEHIFFRYPAQVDEIPNRVGFLPGLDIRGGRGQVVAPPSVHPTGSRYEWIVQPAETDFAEPPDWLLSYLTDGSTHRGRGSAVATMPDGTPAWLHAIWNGAVEGNRNDTMARIAGHYVALLGESEAMAICIAINQAKFDPPLDVVEVEQVVMSISNSERRKKKAEDYTSELSDEVRDDLPSGERRDVAREAASSALNVRIESAFKYRTDPPSYELIVQGARVSLRSVADLIEQRRLQSRIADELGVMTKWVGKDRWPKIAQALLDACEEIAVEEGTERGRLEGWLSAYLSDFPPRDRSNVAISDSSPFLEDGVVHINSTSLRTWLRWRLEERVSALEVSTLLKRYGCSSKQVGVRTSGNVRSLRYWALDGALVPDFGGGKVVVPSSQ